MSNKISFTAFLQDEYTKNFDRLAKHTDAGIKGIEQNYQKLGKTGKLATRNIDELNKRIEVLTKVRRMTVDTKAIKFATQEIKNLQKEKDRLEGGGKSGGASSIFNIAAGVGIAQFAPKAMGMAADFIGNSINASMEREQQRISLGVLMGGQGKGDEMLSKITKEASATPFGTEDLLKASTTMLGFGVAQEKVLPIMHQLGDISGGNADRFQSLTLAFSQMSSTGKLMGQDLLQMVNAGFNPLNEISKMTGKSMGVLKKEMEDGKISANLVMQAMEKATGKGGQFEGMMQKQSQTTAGRISTLKDEYNELSVVIGDRFKPAVDAGIAGLSSMVATVKSWVEIPTTRKMQDEIIRLQALKVELNSANISEERRHTLMDEIKSKYPELLTNLDKEKDKYGELNNRLDDYIGKKKEGLALETVKGAHLKTLSAFEENKNTVENSSAVITGILGQIKAPWVLDKSLSKNQKIEMAKSYLEQRAVYTSASAGTGGASTSTNLEGSLLSQLRDEISKNVKAQKVLQKIMPDVHKANADMWRVNQLMGGGTDPAKTTGTTTTTTTGTGTGSSSSPSISGGSQVKNLTINIDSLIKGGVNISSTTLKESTAHIKDAVVETLLTAVNDANLAGGN